MLCLFYCWTLRLTQAPTFCSNLQQIKQVKPEGPFRLAGYSFGCCVAFEMALQLSDPHQGQPSTLASLHMLDGSHEYVKSHTEVYRQKISSEDSSEAEALVLYSFISNFISVGEYQKVSLTLYLLVLVVKLLNSTTRSCKN